MIIDFSELSANQIYHTMTQALIPRPIAWVLTDNGDQSYNLAPFSYFTAVSSNPPLVMLSIGRKADGGPKDTVANIERSGRFVIHIPHSGQMDQVNSSAASLAHGESEVEWLQLPLTGFDGFELPRLKECRLAMACELYEIKPIGELPQTLVFGKVTSLFVDDEMLSKDEKGRYRIEAQLVDPLGRLGANEFVLLGEIQSCIRPK